MEPEKPNQEAIAPEPVTPEIPKSDFFSGGKMAKFAEQAGIIGKEDGEETPVEKAATPPATKEPVEKKPCVNCGADKDKAKSETRTPIATVKVGTKDVNLYTQQEVNDLFEKMQTAQPKASASDRLANVLKTVTTPEGTATPKETDPDLEMVDPAIRKQFDRYEKEIERLKGFASKYESRDQEEAVNRASAELQETALSVKKENAIEDIVDEAPQGFGNVTEKLFAGAVSVLANEDIMRGRPQKPIEEYLKAAGKMVSLHQTRLKGGGSDLTKIKADELREKNPGLVTEISQAAIADYLREQEGISPNVKAQASEAKNRDTVSRKKNEPSKGISAMLEDFKRSSSSDGFVEAVREKSSSA